MMFMVMSTMVNQETLTGRACRPNAAAVVEPLCCTMAVVTCYCCTGIAISTAKRPKLRSRDPVNPWRQHAVLKQRTVLLRMR